MILLKNKIWIKFYLEYLNNIIKVLYKLKLQFMKIYIKVRKNIIKIYYHNNNLFILLNIIKWLKIL